MAERREQAHRIVRERDRAKFLVKMFRIVVRGIHDQGVHGHGTRDRNGKKHAPEARRVR